MSQKVILQSETFKVSEQKKEESENGETEVVIEGVAVPYETESRNGIIYSEDSIKKAAKSLEGKPFLFNHDPNMVLGRVVEAVPKDNHLAFKAVADPSKEKVRDIKNGYVGTVSIQAMVSESQDGPDNRVNVDEFLELSSAPIPGFDAAKASAQAIAVEEFVANREQQGNVIVRVPEGITGITEARWDPQSMEDFSNEEAYFNAHMVWYTESPSTTDDVAFEVVREEDGELLVSYEALNSAYDLAETADDLTVDDVSKLRARLVDLREKFFPEREPLDADGSEESIDDADGELAQGDVDSMSDEEQEQNDVQEEGSVQEADDASEQDNNLEQKMDQVMALLQELVDQMDNGGEDYAEEDESVESLPNEEVEESAQPETGGADNTVTVEDAANALRQEIVFGDD